jgi:hypothetical protein
MRRGDYRAECSCGWWSDHDREPDARRALDAHLHDAIRARGCRYCAEWLTARKRRLSGYDLVAVADSVHLLHPVFGPVELVA